MGKGRILIYVLLLTACTTNYIDRVVLSVSAQAGILLLVGASVCLIFTRDPIAPEEETGSSAELAYKAAQ
ncbi:MAG: hypothetical protein WBF12_08135 [Bradyrhizobium sp.]